jgi:sulfur-oxidizing protein SoxX
MRTLMVASVVMRVLVLVLTGSPCVVAAEPLAWSGDAVPAPLPGSLAGDAQRGRAIVESRQTGLCLLCHSLQAAGAPLQGTLAPPLAGSGARLTAGQLRARLVDSRRLDPQSIMPAYFVPLPPEPGSALLSTDDPARPPPRHLRIASAWQGRTLLDAQQIEDVIVFLLTLREP